MNTELINSVVNYIKSDPEYLPAVRKTFGIESTVVSEHNGQTKRFGFIGNGCGITYLVIDRRSKVSKELDECVHEIRRRVNDWVYDTFSNSEKEYFVKFGCPVMAVLQQDQDLQIEFYSRVVKYAKEILGVKKIRYHSVID